MQTSTVLILAFLGTCQVVYMALRLRARQNVPHLDTLEGNNAAGPFKEPPPFSWRDAPSTRELDWKPCYENKECTRLSVPLDYKDPNGRQASIALLRKKAELSNTSEYRGPVLVNPGGPGASGVEMVLLVGDLISDILGPEFDIVGFDPRGIGRSTPRASFFGQDVHRAFASKHTSATLLEERDNVARAWSWAEVVGRIAGQTDDGYLRHIHTDYTARDMLSIVEAHGMDKILFWGFSYGAILGSTFAAMFPDRVGRLFIDGVPENDDYYATEWNYNLLDTDKTLESFLTGCAEAGPVSCPFWAADPADIRQNLTNLSANLSANPIPVVGSSTFGVLDDASLHSAVSTALNSPYAWFPLLGKALADPVEHAETFLNLATAPPFTCPCDSESDESLFRVVGDGFVAVACNDGAPLSGGLKSSQEYYDKLSEQSEWGPLWTVNRI